MVESENEDAKFLLSIVPIRKADGTLKGVTGWLNEGVSLEIILEQIRAFLKYHEGFVL